MDIGTFRDHVVTKPEIGPYGAPEREIGRNWQMANGKMSRWKIPAFLASVVICLAGLGSFLLWVGSNAYAPRIVTAQNLERIRSEAIIQKAENVATDRRVNKLIGGVEVLAKSQQKLVNEMSEERGRRWGLRESRGSD